MNDWVIERYAAEVVENENNELASLKDKFAKLQEEYDKVIKKQYHNDYLVENQKKIIENLKTTLTRYEKENRAMRELLVLWI